MNLSAIPEGFMALVHKCPDTGCWNWMGSLSGGDRGVSYGLYCCGGRNYAHRYAYEMAVGPIPYKLHIDHLCRNTLCCNPEHLEPVTCRENLMRGHGTIARLNAEKTHCKHGHPLSGDNLKVFVRNGRYKKRRCMTCHRIACARRYARLACAIRNLKSAARMNRSDAVDRDEMLAMLRVNLATMDRKARTKKARKLAIRHGLSQTPDPQDARAVLYSRKQCEGVWASIKPLPKIAA